MRNVSRRVFLGSVLALPAGAQTQSSNCADDNTAREAASVIEAGLQQGMAQWKVPSASYAILGCGTIRVAHTLGAIRAGAGRRPDARTLYQAASISKTIAAVTALRLVQAGKLGLDEDVTRCLKSWSLPPGPQTADAPVTLRRLLGMTAGVNVPGFPGYDASAKQPNLVEILKGAKPVCNSDPIRVVRRPGAQQAYSGGGYEIAELLMQDAANASFAGLAAKLVFEPLGMRDSHFAHPLPRSLAGQAADGHDSAGVPLLGRSPIPGTTTRD